MSKRLIKKISEGLENSTIFKKAVIGVFLISFSYWIYLIFASGILIRHDAIGYERIGSMIYKKGWVEYFKTGPNREPLYPLSIAISMRIAEAFSISYQLVQKIIQVLILFITQILILRLLSRLRIRNIIKLIAILYFAFSPAIVNSAFSLFSEIIAYPFVLGIIFLGALSWQAIYNSGTGRIITLGFSTALLFALAAFGKGIFQYVFLFFLIPFFCILLNSIKERNKNVLLRSILYIVAVVLVFNSFIAPFKLMNKRFNGHFEFTNRYIAVLFGNAAKRVSPLNSRILFAHLASIPGEGACRLFFSEDECRYCEFFTADYYGGEPLDKLLVGTSEDKIRSKTISLTFQTIAKNPLQYLMFMVIESLRMPFWESTQIGFVNYPSWLERLYNFKLFKNSLRLLIGFLTFLSLLYTLTIIYNKGIRLLDYPSGKSQDVILYLFIFLIIFSYTGLYSIFSILSRYALVISPLFITCIAYFINNQIYPPSHR